MQLFLVGSTDLRNVHQKTNAMRSLSLCFAAVPALLSAPPSAHAFVVVPSFSGSSSCGSRALSSSLNAAEREPQPTPSSSRRQLLDTLAVTTAAAACATLVTPLSANALVEGYAPPSSSKPKALSEEYRQGTAALADMDDMAPVPREAYKKLPSGVTYADLRVGSGEAANIGSKCNVQWVLRKSNGYFVDSSDVSGGVPFIFTVGDEKGAIKGVDEGIRGMKVGGTRRLLIPPSLAYVEGLEDGKPGPLPAGFGPRQQMRRVMGIRKDVPGEYIFLEVQLTKVR